MGYLRIDNTDKRMVDWICQVVGHGKVNTFYPKERRPVHRWTVFDREAEAVLQKIYPFLVIKKEQANIYFRFRKSFEKQYPRGTPPELVTERAKCFEEIKGLHT